MKKLARKLVSVAALALCTASPAFAGSNFLVNFEKTWDYTNGDVNDYYNGGLAADGSSGGNVGVSFTGVSGLSNDFSTFYLNAPSMQGTAYAHTFAPGDTAYMNVAGGVDGALNFFYSSPSAVVGAVKAYSGLNGTGTLLGSYNVVATDFGAGATDSGNYAAWTPVTFTFNGTARSFDLTASANLVGFDNIAAVPEPETYALLLAGLGLVGCIARRSKRQAA
jgi:hypothetical protein